MDFGTFCPQAGMGGLGFVGGLFTLCCHETLKVILVTDCLELLAKLLVEVGRLLQPGLQGGNLLLFNLQTGFERRLQLGFQQLEPERGHV